MPRVCWKRRARRLPLFAACVAAGGVALAAGQPSLSPISPPAGLPTLATVVDEPEVANATNVTNSSQSSISRLSSPKPYGHTSKVHPFNANRDREWYTESRWGSGDHYEVQEGPITARPDRAPPRSAHFVKTSPVKPKAKRPRFPDGITDEHPRGTPSRVHRRDEGIDGRQPEVAAWGRGIDNTVDTIDENLDTLDENLQSIGVDTPLASAAPANAQQAGSSDDSDSAPISRPSSETTSSSPATPAAPGTKFALPKAAGHTSLVHPTKGDSDREWYVEGRMWGEGPRRVTDGPITDLPVHGVVNAPPSAPKYPIEVFPTADPAPVPVDPASAKEVGRQAPATTDRMKRAVEESVEAHSAEVPNMEFGLTRAMTGEAARLLAAPPPRDAPEPTAVSVTPLIPPRRRSMRPVDDSEGVRPSSRDTPSLPSMGAAFLS